MPVSLKSLAERATVATGLPRATRSLHAGRTLVLAYHNVVPDAMGPVGEASLHMPLSRFVEQLDRLARTHDVVPLEGVLDDRRRRRRPRAVLTFDDAYAGALRLALPEVVRRGMSATVFVAPGRLDGHAFWWDRLAGGMGGVLPDALRTRALEEMGGIDERIVRWALGEGLALAPLPADARSATVAEVVGASRLPGIALGCHSWTHANLSALAPDDLEVELLAPRDWLESYCGTSLSWVSYPYGLAAPETEAAACRAGYRAAVLAAGGWLPPVPRRPHALPRLTVPAALSAAGFGLRCDGLPPA